MRYLAVLVLSTIIFTSTSAATGVAGATPPCSQYPGYDATLGYAAWINSVYKVNHQTGDQTLLTAQVGQDTTFTVPSGYVVRGVLKACIPNTDIFDGIINFNASGTQNNNWNTQNEVYPTAAQVGVALKIGTWYQTVPNDGTSFVMTPKAQPEGSAARAVGFQLTITASSTGGISPPAHVAGPGNAVDCAHGDRAWISNVTCDTQGGCGSGIGFHDPIASGDVIEHHVTIRWDVNICVQSVNPSWSYSSGVQVFMPNPGVNVPWENQHYPKTALVSGQTITANESGYQGTPSTSTGEMYLWPRLFAGSGESEGPFLNSNLDVEGPAFEVCVATC